MRSRGRGTVGQVGGGLRRYGETRHRLGYRRDRRVSQGDCPGLAEQHRACDVHRRGGHYHDAVMRAAARVNAETQMKVGRKDVAETDLFNQAFSLDEPKPGAPRLRITQDDGSPTYKNLHRGARACAEGLYPAIRNPACIRSAVRVRSTSPSSSSPRVRRWPVQWTISPAPVRAHNFAGPGGSHLPPCAGVLPAPNPVCEADLYRSHQGSP